MSYRVKFSPGFEWTKGGKLPGLCGGGGTLLMDLNICFLLVGLVLVHLSGIGLMSLNLPCHQTLVDIVLALRTCLLT